MCTATRYIISAAMAIPDDNETYLKKENSAECFYWKNHNCNIMYKLGDNFHFNIRQR